MEWNKKPEKNDSVYLCTSGYPACRWGDGQLGVLKPLPPYSSTHLLQICTHHSACHLQQHPLDHLIKMMSPIHLTQTEGRQEFWSLWRSWIQNRNLVSGKNPLAADNGGQLQDSLCTKSPKCFICGTKNECKKLCFHTLIP